MKTAEQSSTSTSTGRPLGKGGARLSAAFEAVNTLPALTETIARVAKLTARQGCSPGELAEVVESDTAVALAVMRAANNGGGPRGRVGNVPDAVEALTPVGVRALVGQLDTYDFFQSVGNWDRLPDRFRRHAVAVRFAAERIAQLGDVSKQQDLSTAALFHDIGQLVLMRLYPTYDGILDDRGLTPEQRTHKERRELGIDHTLVGGVLARRWGFPSTIASAIERHHSDEANGVAAAVRLGDLIVHHCQGDQVDGKVINEMASRCGLNQNRLHQIVYEFPYERAPKQRRSEPCPLSRREIDALRGLAEGKVYKEIATEMSLSASTVRTHLHNVYRKIGAADRAQAVLVARDRGWV